jgi:hypothetical protein
VGELQGFDSYEEKKMNRIFRKFHLSLTPEEML